MNKKIGVGVIIQNQNNEYLLHLRDEKTKIMTNQWSLVGGGMDFGETSKQAAIREVIEETSLIPIEVIQVGNLVFDDKWDAKIYYAKVDTTNQKIILTEGKQLKFFALNDLNSLFESLEYTNPFLNFLQEHIKK